MGSSIMNNSKNKIGIIAKNGNLNNSSGLVGIRKGGNG